MAKDLERYGVFALIFVVLLIVGISVWGPRREREAIAAEPRGDLQRVADAGDPELDAGRGGDPYHDPEGERRDDGGERGDAWVEGVRWFYKVVPGDNPTRIAEKLFGKGQRFVDALMAANPDRHPRRLDKDMLLRVPELDVPPRVEFLIAERDLPVLPRPAPRPAPESGERTNRGIPSYHIVRTGEPLSKIAQRYYGTTTAMDRILAANPSIRDRNRIRAGMKLVLP